MSKFNCLFLTVTLGLFSLFLFKPEQSVVFKATASNHDIKIDHSLNTCAITCHNSFEELTSFEEYANPLIANPFFAIKALSIQVLTQTLNYLRVCNFFDLSLTVPDIVYPFHSFL